VGAHPELGLRLGGRSRITEQFRQHRPGSPGVVLDGVGEPIHVGDSNRHGSRPFHQRTIGPSAAVAAALIIVGCSNTIITSAPLRDNGPDRPTAGGDELVVDAQQLDAPLVLDPLPAGLSVLESAYNPPDDGYPPSQATLYGDPTFTDTLDGPVLLVGSSSGSAVIGGPPGSAEDGRPVEFGLADGFLLKEGDRTWVSIPTEGQDYTQFVVARGVPEDQLVRAAQRRTSAPRRRLLLSTRFRRGWSR
jgi:hypothetical protein